MSQWYFARGGQQNGPVSFNELKTLASTGQLDAQRDLVWCNGMADWKPAGQIENLFSYSPPAAAAPSAAVTNPYAPPMASPMELGAVSGDFADLQEIEPGSEPIDIGRIFSHSWALVKKHFLVLFLAGLILFAITFAVSFAMAFIQGAFLSGSSGSMGHAGAWSGRTDDTSPLGIGFQLLSNFINTAISVYLTLGIMRIGLNVASGQPASIEMLFGEGRKFWRALGAYILFTLMVVLGCLFLIVPGIYLALRFGQYRTAIVDRDLGVMDAFAYSSRITQNNRSQIFVMWLLFIALSLGGLLTCGLGYIVVLPLTYMMIYVAYRWMQYGSRITQIRALSDPAFSNPASPSVTPDFFENR